MSSKNFKENYNHPGDVEFMLKWHHQPKLIQLRAICQHYDLKPTKNATRTELIRFLIDNNVQMTFSDYDGWNKRLHGAIIHWMEVPQTESDTSGSECECSGSDSDNMETNNEEHEEPMVEDLNATFTIASHEYFPSNDSVQFEVEVEMMELDHGKVY